MLLSDGLLLAARKRLAEPHDRTEIDLRRATSDLYYALFHELCESLASLVPVDATRAASKEAWLNLYRSPDHKQIEKRCRDGRVNEFPQEIRAFANQLATMKTKREDADYDPAVQLVVSEVRKDLEITETVIRDFRAADDVHRKNFAVFVGIKNRTAA